MNRDCHRTIWLGLFLCTGLRGDPEQYEKARDNEGENAIQGITDRVRMTVYRHEDLDTKDQHEDDEEYALPRSGIVQPAPLAKPSVFHDLSFLLLQENSSFQKDTGLACFDQALECAWHERRVHLQTSFEHFPLSNSPSPPYV